MLSKWKSWFITLAFIPALAFNPVFGLLKADEPEKTYPSSSSTPVSDYLREQKVEPIYSEVELMILEQAVLHGVDPDLALYLARFESGLNPAARNQSSTAKGLYQFLDSTWMKFCRGVSPAEVFDPELNAKCAMRIISEGGISHWTADPATKRALVAKGFVE